MMTSTRLPALLDQTLLALADPTRRAILRCLVDGEARITDLAQPFEMSLNAVSKHIRILERAELVRRRRVGREHFLTFNPKPFDDTVNWMNAQRIFWTARMNLLEALLQADDNPPPGISKKK